MNPDDNDDVFDRYATAAERAAYWEETAHRYERRLDASEAALRHADQINGELAQENNYLSDELATAVEMNKRFMELRTALRLPVRGTRRRCERLQPFAVPRRPASPPTPWRSYEVSVDSGRIHLSRRPLPQRHVANVMRGLD